MTRGRLIAGFALAVVICGAGEARGGGTVVVAPDRPSEADCAPGSKPAFEGVGDDSLIVLGCATPDGSLPVVMAGALEHVYACFYVAPPSGQDEGPCAQVRSTRPLFGGRLTREMRAASPVTGGDRLAALRIGTYGSGLYASGQVPAGVRQVRIRASDSRIPAALLPVPLEVGSRLGATHPFSVFVALIPEAIDTCESGVSVVAKGPSDRLEAAYHPGRHQAYPAGNAPLPGGRRCATGGAWEVRASVKAVGASARKASRLKPADA